MVKYPKVVVQSKNTKRPKSIQRCNNKDGQIYKKLQDIRITICMKY